MQNNKKKVVMDLDAIMEFIFAPDEKRSSDVQLEETFFPEDENNPSSKLQLMQRVRHESKSGEHAQHEAIRVQMVSRLLDSVDELETDGESIVGDSNFGEEVALNTLFSYGFLKTIE